MNRFVKKEFLRTRRGKGEGQAKALRHANNSGGNNSTRKFLSGSCAGLAHRHSSPCKILRATYLNECRKRAVEALGVISSVLGVMVSERTLLPSSDSLI
jgi:hypothetical protein